MYGGQSIPTFEYSLAPYVAKTFIKHFLDAIAFYNERGDDGHDIDLDLVERNLNTFYDVFGTLYTLKDDEHVGVISWNAYNYAVKKTEKDTYQAMEALIHNLNTMQSRAGAQTPFSSINYGTGTTWEQRLIIKSVLLATDAGLGHHETPIFPVQIFKVKDGINSKDGDPNYDLFKLAQKVTANRLFPNFSFLDATYNVDKYDPDDPNTEIAIMGCRTRVYDNHYCPDKQIVTGRGNISFTTINLPRLAINSKGDHDKFFDNLRNLMYKIQGQLLSRFELIAQKKVYNFPFLMGQGTWLDSYKLSHDDEIREVLKHGSMSIGFIGLAECLKVLIGKHHGESEEAQALGLRIIKFMRSITDKMTEETGLNFSLFATPAEGLSGRFVKIDKKIYGEIKGVTDRDYYTNSFHVPVYYNISAADKIRIEGPFHELCNAGSISYVEMDGDLTKNVEAFEKVILWMKECGVGYGSINHPVDRCPVCNYVGVIGDTCPRCGRRDGEGVSIERLKKLGVGCICTG